MRAISHSESKHPLHLKSHNCIFGTFQFSYQFIRDTHLTQLALEHT